MRLIDADALLRHLEYPAKTNITCGDIRKLIEAETTTYDVDKVVEQLKRASYRIAENTNNVVESKEAIKIVKEGGVNEKQ